MDNNQHMMKSLTSPVIKGIDEETRTIEFLGTSSKQDRSGDIIETDGWDIKNFMDNPVFLWAHNGRSVPPIGRALEVSRTPQGLKFRIQFATKEVHPFADTVFKLYGAGFLKGVSVGFIPKKREVMTDPQTGEFTGFKFLEQELIELSAVSVPDNPEALIQEAVDGVLNKEAAEFLSKSLEVESSFGTVIQELKKEILLMSKEVTTNATVEGDEGTQTTESKTENTDKTLDKRLEKVENRLEQLEAHAEMQKSATEVFQVVKTLLEGLRTNVGNSDQVNPFLKVLAPGIEPQGNPEDQKALIDAITKATSKLATWTPAQKTDN